MSRPKVGIVIDYTIRIPDFKECYHKCKSEIISGLMSQEGEAIEAVAKDKSDRSFWVGLHQTDPKAYSFYETCLAPQENYGPGFDYTYKKYFYNNEHRIKFLEDWTYNLYGQGSVNNAADIKLINICQTKVCDVVLIDRTTHTRKVPNTLAYLSRTQIFIKEIKFISQIDELKALKTQYIDIYDPIEDNTKALTPSRALNQPSESFVEWLMGLEAKIKNKK